MDMERSPEELARSAAEELRLLNHASFKTSVFVQPADVAGVVDALAMLLDRLPQALDQAAAGLRHLADQDAIAYVSDGSDVTDQVHQVTNALNTAKGMVQGARSALTAAGPVSRMGGHPAPANEPEEPENAHA
jgi:hypothetical protein